MLSAILSASSAETLVIVISIITICAFLFFAIFIAMRLKKCPSDKIMVVYGKVNGGGSSQCFHGGAVFVWPVFQSYQFLDLTPISVTVDLKRAIARHNTRIDVPAVFTVAISTEEGVMQNAAERLLGLGQQDIRGLATDIIFGRLRFLIAATDIEEIDAARDKFLETAAKDIEGELNKIGLRLINVNITDITLSNNN